MSDKSRRKLLKSIAAGSGAIVAGKSLPESWSRPVVDSVMLPAHAETSPPPPTTPPPPTQTLFTGTSSTTEASIAPSSIFANALDSLLPSASAQPFIWTFQTHLCINDIGDDKVDVDAVIEAYLNAELSESASFSAKGITADGSTQDLDFVERCPAQLGNLLDQLGLINDANAGGLPSETATITVIIGETAMGTVTLGMVEMDYAISGTVCNLPILACDNN